MPHQRSTFPRTADRALSPLRPPLGEVVLGVQLGVQTPTPNLRHCLGSARTFRPFSTRLVRQLLSEGQSNPASDASAGQQKENS